jgi:hypothetical protein
VNRRRAVAALTVLGISACTSTRRRQPPLPGEELYPLSSDLSLLGRPWPYFPTVRDRLLNRASSSAIIVMPSFEKEWAVQVVYDRGIAETFAGGRGVPSLRYSIPSDQLHGSMETGKLASVSVRAHAVVVSQGVAESVETAVRSVVEWAEMPADPRPTIDGTGYMFLRSGSGGGCMAWDPQAGTAARALADLADALRGFADPGSAGGRPTEAALQGLAQLAVSRSH